MSNLTVIDQRKVLGKEFKIYGDLENPLFLAKHVAEWIEHSNPTVMIMQVEENEKVLNNVYTLGGNQESWFLTEDGLMEILFQSRKPIAKEFKMQVKTILKEIRKNGTYANPQLSKEIQAIFALDTRTVKLETQLNDLQDNMPLFNVECDELQALVRKVGMKCLGGKESPAYKDRSLRTKVYSDIQSILKREFGVDRYKAIKRSQIAIATEIVENYKLPLVLSIEITELNRGVA